MSGANVQQWTPIQHGRFILRSTRESGETVEQLYIRCRPDVPKGVRQAELARWQRFYEAAQEEEQLLHFHDQLVEERNAATGATAGITGKIEDINRRVRALRESLS